MLDKLLRFLSLLSLLFIVFAAGMAARHFDLPATQTFSEAFDALNAWVMQKREQSRNPPELVVDMAQLNEKNRVRWKPDMAFNGYTLMTYRYSPNTYLLDMQGKIVHVWKMPFHAAWPRPQHIQNPVGDEWIYVEKAHVFPNGDLVMIYTGIGDTPYGYGMVKLDKDSNILWTFDENAHHDFHVDPRSGNITALVQHMEKGDDKLYGTGSSTVLVDELVVLSPKGREISRLSIGDAFQNSPYALLLNDYQKNSAQWDRFHTNSVDVLQPELAEKFPMFAPGNVLLSIRNMDTVAVIDMDKKSVIWAYNGLWRAQHSAHFLSNGNILVFDNKGHAEGRSIYSRIVEMNPATLGINWSFVGSQRNPFFTDSYGRVQRLPNGNTLITESLKSHVFEVDMAGKKVWEYRIPQVEIQRSKKAPRSTEKVDKIPYYQEEPLLFEPLVTGIVVSATRYAKGDVQFLEGNNQ